MFVVPQASISNPILAVDDDADMVVSNECDSGFPEGTGHWCDAWHVTLISLRNTVAGLEGFFAERKTYPLELDGVLLGQCARCVWKLPYQVTALDGWGNRLTYLRKPDGSGYILASPGEERGKYIVSLENLLDVDKTVGGTAACGGNLVVRNGSPICWPEGYGF